MEERSGDRALDALPCGFLRVDDAGRILFINAALLRMLGHARDQVVGRSLDRLLPPGSRIFYQTHLFPLLRLHGHADEIFLLLRDGQGQDVGVLLNGERREQDGTFVTDLVAMRVRERQKFEGELLRARRAAEEAERAAHKRAEELELANLRLQEQALELELGEEELRVLNEELELRTEELDVARIAAEEANAAKSRFLANMSHELRTPLNAIGGYTQLMEMGIHGPTTDAQLEALRRIDGSQRHLLRLINEVLNLSRIQSGQLQYDVKDFRLRDVLDDVVPMVEPQAAAAALSLTVDVPPGLGVRADFDKLGQVLINLLGNAVKFTPAGGRITLDAGEPLDDARVVVIRVSDTGVGIPESRLGSIFEPFVQVDESPSSRREGTGLGLAISRDLARGMGGELTAASRVGEGSTFTLTLPRDTGAR